MGHDHSSPGIKSEGRTHSSMFSAYGRGNAITRSVWPRSSIKDSFSSFALSRVNLALCSWLLSLILHILATLPLSRNFGKRVHDCYRTDACIPTQRPAVTTRSDISDQLSMESYILLLYRSPWVKALELWIIVWQRYARFRTQ